jgi:hypothetical protein
VLAAEKKRPGVLESFVLLPTISGDVHESNYKL